VLLVLGILLVQVAIWVPIVLVLRRRTAARLVELTAELATGGERVVRPPAPGSYRGASATGFARVKGNCVIALTDRRVVYRMLVGPGGEIALTRVTAVREDPWFRGARKGGRTHLILQVDGDGEVAFYVADHAAWLTALGVATGG
jgi:hypothetical protein